MELICPRSGFDFFLAYRAVGSDEVEIILPEEDSYVFEDIDGLKLWMRQVGVYQPFIERFVDLIWNWRLLRFDLRTQHLSIPDVQLHPLEDNSAPRHPFRAPRRADIVGGRDIFDPLQDPQIWSDDER